VHDHVLLLDARQPSADKMVRQADEAVTLLDVP